MEGIEEKATSPRAGNLNSFREVEQGVYKWGWRGVAVVFVLSFST